MSKPSHVPVWATSSVYATSNDPSAVGQPTKNDPSSIAAQGWDYASRPDPTFFNYWQNEVGAWLAWTNTDVFSTEGGTYNLSSVLALGSNGLTIWDAAELTITSDSYFYLNGIGTITGTGSLVLASGADMVLASGANFTMTAGSTILGDPNFAGGTWEWASPQTVDSTLTFSGVGHRRDRIANGANGNASYGIANGDEILIPLQTGADHTYTLSTTGAGNGSRMRFSAVANNGSYYVQIATAEGTFFLRNAPGASGGLLAVLDVVFFSGAWHASAPIPLASL